MECQLLTVNENSDFALIQVFVYAVTVTNFNPSAWYFVPFILSQQGLHKLS